MFLKVVFLHNFFCEKKLKNKKDILINCFKIYSEGGKGYENN